jgi:hypothetical protein
MDPECIKLCSALNELPGVRTFESCCGHGEHGFWVWFEITNPTALGLLLLSRCLYNRHGRVLAGSNKGWRAVLDYFDRCPRICFLLEGPVGDYVGADELAEEILKYTQSRKKTAG